MSNKIAIYQLFPRLFGNENTNFTPLGSKAQNGCGTFSAINNNALQSISQLGITHIWYTGIPEHATTTDYSSYDISPDNPSVVKGRAGSPYAIKDYYDVSPDLADDPKNRINEFKALVERTHNQGLKVIIDFVPNHVARNYYSDNLPNGHIQLGKFDDPSQHFLPENNFYYIPGSRFVVPEEAVAKCRGYKDINKTRPYYEFPAKASGNDNFTPSPSVNDWYETVKLNYGINYGFHNEKHFNPIPNTWNRMLDILEFWCKMGVDGFRCDMAEMVPVEFWNWVIPRIKVCNPGIIFIAEVYNPHLYGEYIHEGKFDFLYDKVGLYDTLRALTEGKGNIEDISRVWQNLNGLDKYMLRFMENHDEQRIASQQFAGIPEKGLPAMVVSAMMHQGPVMIYNGQELGEQGDKMAGFSGDDGRTTIFDYWNMPEVQRWNNGGAFNNTKLTKAHSQLRKAYSEILNFCSASSAISNGEFYDLMWINKHLKEKKLYAFIRHNVNENLLVLASFNNNPVTEKLNISTHVLKATGMEEMEHIKMTQHLPEAEPDGTLFHASDGGFTIQVNIAGFGYQVFRF